MGGSAFSATLPASALPRIPPVVYHAVKARLTPRLQTLYSIVSTPYEAPEKSDHGDLDFLVCEPLNSATEVPYEDVQTLLKAKYVVPMPGNRTSSYAVLIEMGEWERLGHGSEEEEARRCAAETDNQQEIYYQVIPSGCRKTRSDMPSIRSMCMYAPTRRSGGGSSSSTVMAILE